MKTTIFLLLFFTFAFACEGKQDVYILKTDSGFRIILTKYGGDKEFPDSIFNERHPQYANKTKKTLRAGINDAEFRQMAQYLDDTSAPEWFRKIVIIE